MLPLALSAVIDERPAWPLVDDDESVRSDAWRGVRVRDAVDVHRVVGGTSELPGTT
jgi:hypothetical protein